MGLSSLPSRGFHSHILPPFSRMVNFSPFRGLLLWLYKYAFIASICFKEPCCHVSLWPPLHSSPLLQQDSSRLAYFCGRHLLTSHLFHTHSNRAAAASTPLEHFLSGSPLFFLILKIIFLNTSSLS